MLIAQVPSRMESNGVEGCWKDATSLSRIVQFVNSEMT